MLCSRTACTHGKCLSVRRLLFQSWFFLFFKFAKIVAINLNFMLYWNMIQNSIDISNKNIIKFSTITVNCNIGVLYLNQQFLSKHFEVISGNKPP